MTKEPDNRPIVVGVDGTDHSKIALSKAVAEARVRSAELQVVYVSDVSPAHLLLPDGQQVHTRDLAAAKAAAVWEMVEEVVSESNIEWTKVDLDGYPADVLVDYVETSNPQLLVVGTRGRGRMSKAFLGSTSSRAVERVSCDVLVAKTDS